MKKFLLIAATLASWNAFAKDNVLASCQTDEIFVEVLSTGGDTARANVTIKTKKKSATYHINDVKVKQPEKLSGWIVYKNKSKSFRLEMKAEGSLKGYLTLPASDLKEEKLPCI